MNKRQTTIVSIFVLFAALLALCGCKDNEKEIIDLAKFKNINIQKIVLKDLADNSTETVLGLMTEYETFDNISKRTLTVEKPELSKWIESLAILEQKENEKIGNSNKKYKFYSNH